MQPCSLQPRTEQQQSSHLWQVSSSGILQIQLPVLQLFKCFLRLPLLHHEHSAVPVHILAREDTTLSHLINYPP